MSNASKTIEEKAKKTIILQPKLTIHLSIINSRTHSKRQSQFLVVFQPRHHTQIRSLHSLYKSIIFPSTMEIKQESRKLA